MLNEHPAGANKKHWLSPRTVSSQRPNGSISQNSPVYLSYFFKLVRVFGHFLKKNRSRPGSNLLVEHHFAHRDSPPEHVVNFKPFSLGGYLDSDGIPHHSSDVFRHGESISDGITDVRALYPSTSGRFSQTSGFFTFCPQELEIAGELENVAHLPSSGRSVYKWQENFSVHLKRTVYRDPFWDSPNGLSWTLFRTLRVCAPLTSLRGVHVKQTT